MLLRALLRIARGGLLFACAAVAVNAGIDAQAQYYGRVHDEATRIVGPTPAQMDQMGVDEKLGARVPLDATFVDHTGRQVRLGDLVDGERPVLLQFAYFTCPALCNLVQDGVVKALAEVPWTIGDQYRVITLSIDPRDTPQTAARNRQRMLSRYDRAEARKGWHFLVGREPEIVRVAGAVGFRYFWDPRQEQYGHPAVVVLLSPSGVVARYLYGLEYAPADLRLGLFEASEGRSMSTLDRALLYCFHYDPREGRYVVVARNVMRLGGVVTLAGLGAFLGFYWLREWRRRRDRRAAPSPALESATESESSAPVG
jgi:protein SCO1/2